MSVLIHLSSDPAAAALLSHSLLVPLEGDGLLDTLDKTNLRIRTLARGAAVTIAIIFVLYHAIASRLAMVKVIVAVIAGGLLVWGTWSVTAVKDRIGNDLDSAGPVGAHSTMHAPATVRR